MKLLTIAALTLMSTTAMADHDNGNGNSQDNKGGNSSANTNKNSNKNSNKASARQGQLQGQLQGQAQGQVNGNSNNKQSTTVNVGGDEARRIPVSTAFAPSINPTATCMGSTTAGGQGMSIGVSVGSSWESENCMYLETARSFEQAGYKSDALAIRCQTSYAKAAPSCKALNRTGGDPYKAEYWTD